MLRVRVGFTVVDARQRVPTIEFCHSPRGGAKSRGGAFCNPRKSSTDLSSGEREIASRTRSILNEARLRFAAAAVLHVSPHFLLTGQFIDLGRNRDIFQGNTKRFE